MAANDLRALVDRYLEIWNERDAGARRRLIAKTWTEDATYADPLLEGVGHDGIDAMIGAAQAQFGHYRFRLTGAIDAHHDRIRFSWELSDDGADVQVAGVDFGVVSADGRLASITGFFDIFPGGGGGA